MGVGELQEVVGIMEVEEGLLLVLTLQGII
ncbi:hypothetical protein SDC9_28975 [bioreactor metagenome]|uniref:Uncharacterized protein n=1 Tax=bioreactor metagenome TaxID=1076179 RepID=A0A644UWA4_9ZZZZ